MSIPIAAVIVRVVWLAVEYPLVSRYRIKILNDQDKHSAKLWDIANLLEPVGLILGFIGFGQIVTAGKSDSSRWSDTLNNGNHHPLFGDSHAGQILHEHCGDQE
jgi:hypothetical protein